jgi:hypothetical protein
VDVPDYPLNLHITYDETVPNGTAFYDYNVALEQSYDRSLSVPSILGNIIRTTQKSVGSQVCLPDSVYIFFIVSNRLF